MTPDKALEVACNNLAPEVADVLEALRPFVEAARRLAARWVECDDEGSPRKDFEDIEDKEAAFIAAYAALAPEGGQT